VLYEGMSKTSPWAALYFIALMTFGNYVLFNLLVAILVEGFSSAAEVSLSLSVSLAVCSSLYASVDLILRVLVHWSLNRSARNFTPINSARLCTERLQITANFTNFGNIVDHASKIYRLSMPGEPGSSFINIQKLQFKGRFRRYSMETNGRADECYQLLYLPSLQGR